MKISSAERDHLPRPQESLPDFLRTKSNTEIKHTRKKRNHKSEPATDPQILELSNTDDRTAMLTLWQKWKDQVKHIFGE